MGSAFNDTLIFDGEIRVKRNIYFLSLNNKEWRRYLQFGLAATCFAAPPHAFAQFDPNNPVVPPSQLSQCSFANTNSTTTRSCNATGAGAGQSSPGAHVQIGSSIVTVDSSPAIQSTQSGIAGADGYNDNDNIVLPGNGGNGGEIYVDSNGSRVTLTTTGSGAAGFDFESVGAPGGNIHGIDVDMLGSRGGSGGPVYVMLQSTTVNTGQSKSDKSSPGLFAVSEGNVGGPAGGDNANGGAGGAGGAVYVSIDSNSSIKTSGNDSSGVIAASLSGDGNVGTGSGLGGSSGDAQGVVVSNAGSITTAGDDSRGIVAQSMPGTGGTGGTAYGILYGKGGKGGASGTTGPITVDNSGQIVTSGDYAEGILAQSISGGGGAGGAGGSLFAAIGGSGAAGGAGGTVDIDTHSSGGKITTSGQYAIGIVGQSIGGGGGAGGSTNSVAGSVGGTGGGGGGGGAVTAKLLDQTIATSGDNAHGVVLQSIGGGGGNGGASIDTEVVPGVPGVSIGGKGGNGGHAGMVSADLSSGTTITTSGSKAAGLVVQSVGGGGGTGGTAIAGSVTAGFAAAVAVGGSGGKGGDGAAAEVTLVGSNILTGQNPLLINGCAPSAQQLCNTLPVDAYGVVVQSIGGGGGLGGSAVAKSLAVAIPVDEELGTDKASAYSLALGGSGGVAGNGNAARFSLSDGSTVSTRGQGATAVLVQSIGGGGGAGGDSSATSMTAGPTWVPLDGDDPLQNRPLYSFSAAIGGSGGAGGNGGEVDVALGGTVSGSGTFGPDVSGSAKTAIVTYGDYADGVKAQSIGGGGGDGGTGAASSEEFGSGTTSSKTISVGGTGAAAGAGGTVNVQLLPGSSIKTYGSGAFGIMAQSIGGGGGASQGATIGFGVPVGDSAWSVNPSINLGATGGAGGAGGSVSVLVEAPIATSGGGSVGVLAQSIGGGGGVGGSAGSDGAADNPITNGLGRVQTLAYFLSFLSDPKVKNVPISISPSVSVGGGAQAGAGNDGGNAAVNVGVVNGIDNDGFHGVSGTVTTSGDWADGIEVQSIGGGGGKGGSAVQTGTGGDSMVKISASERVGGGQGATGNGSNAAVNFNYGKISTSGFGAAGVVVQSIGGGGGIGVDGSDSAAGTLWAGAGQVATLVGTATTGSSKPRSITTSGSGGGGATTSLCNDTLYCGASLYYQNLAISTKGAAADGAVLQSIGGGGGIAGAGSSSFQSTSKQAGSLTLMAGGESVATDQNGDTFPITGNGGNVQFISNREDYFGDSITTSGNDAFGILAQSIGGGGGSVFSQPGTTGKISYVLGGVSYNGVVGGNGGNVTVSLDGAFHIYTSGVAAHGIVAQSIGGGGGVLRVVHSVSDPTSGLMTWMGNLPSSTGYGNGGNVSVSMNPGGDDGDTITVTGAEAVGILAQSVGGGGGLVNNNDGAIQAGTTGGTHGGGVGGQVMVTTAHSVIASGQDGIGVFAQSTGQTGDAIIGSVPQVGVQVTVNGSVIGGTGAGATYRATGSAGVVVDTPQYLVAGNSSGPKYVNNLTVKSGGLIATYGGNSNTGTTYDPNGTAILASGGGTLTVNNYGTITGSVCLNGGTMNNSGTYNAGSGNCGGISNVRGSVAVPGPANGSPFNAGAAVDGALVNSGTMNLGMPGTKTAQTTVISGDFTQTSTGQLNVLVDSANQAASQLHVNGNASVDGRIVPSAVSLLPGALPVVVADGKLNQSLSPSVLSSLLFNWSATHSGNTLLLSPSFNARPLGMALSANESSFVDYLTRIWNKADARFATQFARLSQLTGTGQYRELLDAFSGKHIYGQAVAFANATRTMLGSSMSCPIFTDNGTQLGEGSCAWAKATGRSISQWGGADAEEGHSNDVSSRVGGQTEIAPNWYLGGSFAVDHAWSIANGGSSGNGQTFDGSIALKHTMGPWLFAGSVAMGGGTFQNNRTLDLPFMHASLQSNPKTFFAGVRLRAGYELAFNDWYVRPYNDLDVIYTHLSGFQETGSALGSLNVSGGSKTSVVLSPMVEIGGRWDLSNKTTIRPFVAVGASFRPDHTYTFDAGFAGVSSNVGMFHNSFELPSAQANLDLGLQVYRAGGFDIKAEYNLEVGRGFRSQSGSLRIAHSF